MPAVPTDRFPARRWSRYAQRCETGYDSAIALCLHAERHRCRGSTPRSLLSPDILRPCFPLSGRRFSRLTSQHGTKSTYAASELLCRKEPRSMKHTTSIQRTLDLVIGRQIFTTCWLSASLGISIVQMRLLAQAWLVLPHALAPACLMSAWILGSLVGSWLSGDTRVWGSSSLGCILLWLISPSLVSWRLSLGLVSPALISMPPLTSLAVLLGASSTAWLAQQRSWPAVGERLALARRLVGLTVGLVVAWMLPAVACLIALPCCLPLVALAFLLSARCPLPRSLRVSASWLGS